jgi:tRNA 2-selenouridine synthase
MKEGTQRMQTITVENMLQLDSKILFDLRSPKEYQQGTITDAISLPILDDEERAIVGTIYKQESKDKAKLIAIKQVSDRLGDLVNRIITCQEQHNNVILFCSRGGYRSGPLVQLLNSLEIPVRQLVGGYKSYRLFVTEYFKNQIESHRFIVLHGYTGCGKTAVLNRLHGLDYPVIDLEAMANNSGSVFGTIGHPVTTVTQKQFESELMQLLMAYEGKPVFIESESSRIGAVTIPKKMHQQMHLGHHVLINASMEDRVDRLVAEYCAVRGFNDELNKALDDLVKQLGHDQVNYLKHLLQQQCYREIAEELIVRYYDPLYHHSIKKYEYALEITYDTMEKVLGSLSDFYRMLTA